MPYCTNCWAQVAATARFCRNCGQALGRPATTGAPKKNHDMRLVIGLVLGLFLLILAFVVIGLGTGLFALLPLPHHGTASFIATNVQFTNTAGTIGIRANITNISPSKQSLIQVDVFLDGQYDGTCGYGFKDNTSNICVFTDPNSLPLATCGSLPQGGNYTLSFDSFFVPGDTVFYEIYPVTPSELGCN